MLSLDISKCFDTLYTHSIEWAIKSKEYAKENKCKHDFSSKFDLLIRQLNYGETNGIVIGPELSRIFAEIILQTIDRKIMAALDGLIHNQHYAIRRYLDDFYVFTNDEKIENRIRKAIHDELWKFKFRLNPKKSVTYTRPFTTVHSRNVSNVRQFLSQSFDKFFVIAQDGQKSIRHIVNPELASSRLIRDIKSCWNNTCQTQSSFSGYVLTSLLRQVTELTEKLESGKIKYNENSLSNLSIYIFQIGFFCFSLSPKVSESYKFCRLALVLYKTLQDFAEVYVSKYSIKVKESLWELLNHGLNNEHVCGVEQHNVILALCAFGDEFRPEPSWIIRVLLDKKEIGYFDIIVALFIAKDSPDCEVLKATVIERTLAILAKNRSIIHSSESIHLLFDCLSCPYLSVEQKRTLAKYSVEKTKGEKTILAVEPDEALIEELLHWGPKYNWFVNWGATDTLNILQRKLLKQAY